MRLLFATKPHLPLVGGAQMTIHQLAQELQARGHAITVLALTDHRCRHGCDDRIDRHAGYLTIRRARPEPTLRRAVEALRPDVVVVNGYHGRMAGWTRAMLESAAPAPTILYVHDVGAVEAAARARADRVLTVSRFLAGELRERGREAEWLPPIVDPDLYRTVTTRRTALFVNPVRDKGIATVLSLARAHPDIPFELVRCWHIPRSALSMLRAEARRLGNVEIRDSVHDPQRIYANGRVLLAPSIYPEAFGRVVREAQASGIPPIASDLGGLRESVGDGGVLVDPRHGVDAWSAALERLWQDRAEYERAVASAERVGASEECSARVVGERFEAILGEVAGAPLERAA